MDRFSCHVVVIHTINLLYSCMVLFIVTSSVKSYKMNFLMVHVLYRSVFYCLEGTLLSEMKPSLMELSVLDSVEVREPQKTQTYVQCDKPSRHVPNVVAFLIRNAFVVSTMAAVALGKWF